MLLAGAAALFLLKGKGKPATGLGSSNGAGDGTGSDADVGGGAADGSGGGGSAGGVTRPPNVSSDPDGYNTEVFPNPLAVRSALKLMGYDIAINNDPIGSKDQQHPAALAFQAHYNQASSMGFHGAKGELKMDGWMGADSLNAIEIIFIYSNGPGEDEWAAMHT